ncbi:flagellar basal-body MS-ring/collar protein FliF [Ramlibacter sp.]|uniref:flagellar basal-body MS-ring/collar protein FliF n=1 Tax=Ramlibacter sp. TaxID=1917967 RepID=UPI00180F4B36|nr:flagellar basal-body MS-ring/collar protein FliF [Ramlibacter sp.]MBA2673207.1 flagellar M-ring protein FliF [Ramlibacter sp.]
MFNDLFASLTPRARRTLLAGVVAIVLATAGAATWLLRSDNQVLFTELKPQDAAMMVAELERQKIPYQLADGGATILVDGAIVHATRLKLMGKDMPLHGAAGFELFNNGDFGMTEFAQKINYQRALQGEITRTILALDEVRDARVHLALPEEGLFKRASSKAKAAITLTMKAGQTLRADQVSGIQRLVAAAVPGIVAQDVTIVDQQGVALTRAAGGEPEAESGSARLDLKRDTEKLLTRKATEVLERAFGAGQAMATVDVTLNMDQVRVTTEDVISTPGHNGKSPSGVVVRERETVRDAGPPLAGAQDLRASNSQREVDYQVGKRVEQVVTQPGAVRRIHVAAVVRQPLDAQQLEMARMLLTAAVGGVGDRGDTIVVQTLKAFDTAAQASAVVPQSAQPAAAVAVPAARPVAADAWKAPLVAAVAIAAVFAVLVAWFAGRRRPVRVEGPPVLSEGERRALAAQIKQWLEEGTTGDLRPASAVAFAPRLPEAQA